MMWGDCRCSSANPLLPLRESDKLETSARQNGLRFLAANPNHYRNQQREGHLLLGQSMGVLMDKYVLPDCLNIFWTSGMAKIICRDPAY